MSSSTVPSWRYGSQCGEQYFVIKPASQGREPVHTSSDLLLSTVLRLLLRRLLRCIIYLLAFFTQPTNTKFINKMALYRNQRCADPQISSPRIIRVRKHQVRRWRTDAPRTPAPPSRTNAPSDKRTLGHKPPRTSAPLPRIISKMAIYVWWFNVSDVFVNHYIQ